MQLVLPNRLASALKYVAQRQNEQLADLGFIAKSTATGVGIALLESAILAKYPLAFDQPQHGDAQPDATDSTQDHGQSGAQTDA